MYSGDKLTLYLRLLAEYPPGKAATGVEVVVPLPRAVQRVHFELGAWWGLMGGRVWVWMVGLGVTVEMCGRGVAGGTVGCRLFFAAEV